MSAIVLAAGPGGRLEPLTQFLPKPLLPVVNRLVIHGIAIGGIVGDASTLASTLERYPAGTTRVRK